MSQIETNSSELQEILEIIDVLPKAVKVTSQTFTESEKAQARNNIGAASSTDDIDLGTF